ncbi:hypothetical protein BO70DRAFT_359284 [Aspergillus heteromorphus CBS 117.55]|uniref:Uncharacterized protein n=1 Tax=Aspergillus heteromorphus CBS 117.55 TaxID=1448321 RepID=A0A317WT71_9EURO|nr:uncharacterized protein BO70DRAFT_359284 [Aspergillus heteromorphus CBS 117.55]PWY88981.1 hypothetical protein BO70DRAFT_359284 [Aspergillus heteromorphus CBS 117.55]
MSSLGHELGTLFGFLSACFVVMGVYVYFWRAAEHRDEKAEQLRRQMLLTRGIHHGQGGVREKILLQTRPPNQPLPGQPQSSTQSQSNLQSIGTLSATPSQSIFQSQSNLQSPQQRTFVELGSEGEGGPGDGGGRGWRSPGGVSSLSPSPSPVTVPGVGVGGVGGGMAKRVNLNAASLATKLGNPPREEDVEMDTFGGR